MDSGHTERRKSESAGMASVPNHLFALFIQDDGQRQCQGTDGCRAGLTCLFEQQSFVEADLICNACLLPLAN